MAEIGHGYGSEWHLLRFLGRHREWFDRLVLSKVGGRHVDWLDFPYRAESEWFDAEWKGVDFVERAEVREAWRRYWPQTGNVQNWDAVGRLRTEGGTEFLLVEAKAHLAEARSDCGAKTEGGLATIERALQQTKEAFGAPSDVDWLHGYYQYCNRLATLYFLTSNGIPARLLFVYFVGDRPPDGRSGASAEDWTEAFRTRQQKLGVNPSSQLASRVHDLLIEVSGRPV